MTILTTVVVIAVVVFLIFNPFELDQTQSSGTEALENSLAVMYFENIQDPEDKEHTGEMLINLLITSLSQIDGLEVISRERLIDVQKEEGENNFKNISPIFAERVAKSAGISKMLVGSIVQEEPAITVTMRLIDVQTGKIISSHKVSNFPNGEIFNLVDSLAYLLSNDFAISRLQIKDVAKVTTNSVEAYRAYAEGLSFYFKNDFNEAKSAFERAVELDSNFAMAYFYLSIFQQRAGEALLSWESFQKAVELVDNVTESERLQILARNYMKLNKPYKAIETFNQVIERYPHERYPYTYLFLLYKNDFLNPEKAIEICHLALKNNPSFKRFWNALAYSFASINNRNEAFKAINNYINSASFEPNPYDSKGDLYVWFMNFDSCKTEYQKATELRKDYASSKKLGNYYILEQNYQEAIKHFHMSGYTIPVIQIHRGKIINTKNKLSAILNSQISRADLLMILQKMIHLSYETGQFSEMLQLANELSKELKKDPEEKIYGRNFIAWALTKLGKYSESYRLLDSIRTDIAESTPRLKVKTDYLSAIISFEEGNYRTALKKFEKAFEVLPPNHEPNFFYSVCLLKDGYVSKAIIEFKRLIYWPGNISTYLLAEIIGAVGYWPIQTVKAHYWLGVAYEQQGKKEEAIKEYRKFLDIWKDADFKSVEIDDANKRILKVSKTIKKKGDQILN